MLILLALIALAGAAAFAFRADLRAVAFNLTGEESLTGQVRGLAQLALNITRPRPITRPDVAVQHADVNPFGVNTFLHNEVEIAKREQTLRLLADAGFYWVREQFPWEDIEIHGRGDFIDRRNDPDGVDAWAKYDNIVDLVEQHGMQLIVRLDNPPSWSRSQPDEVIGSFAPPDDYDDFARFAAIVAERYRGRVRYFQIWNEPNIYPEWGEQTVSPEQYTDLLCRAYRAIKEANPDAVVISGTLAPTSELTTRDFNDFLFLQRMYDAGAGECFDILSVQGYGLWSGPTDHRMRPIVINYARSQYIRDIMVRNGDAHKAIWISEMNWNAAPPDVDPRYGRVTLEQQARYAPLAYQRAEAEWPWVGVVAFWYFKRPDSSWLDERRPEAYFQMADPDFNLMPVYDALKDYIAGAAVMYPGAHAAGHWAVSYGAGWGPSPDPYGGARAASAGAQGISFTFEGSSLAVLLEAAGAGARVRVDGGPWRELVPGEDRPVWRGRGGRHMVEIEPLGETIIRQYVVKQAPPLAPAAAGALFVALAVLSYVLRRRLHRGGADG
ncbi:MAG: hypothetical protein Kow00124_10130 [Anaerolineae bacterium]